MRNNSARSPYQHSSLFLLSHLPQFITIPVSLLIARFKNYNARLNYLSLSAFLIKKKISALQGIENEKVLREGLRNILIATMFYLFPYRNYLGCDRKCGCSKMDNKMCLIKTSRGNGKRGSNLSHFCMSLYPPENILNMD